MKIFKYEIWGTIWVIILLVTKAVATFLFHDQESES